MKNKKLFSKFNLSYDRKELNNNNIDIRYKEVLDFYHQCFNTDETIAHFDEKYDQQLDQLGEKMKYLMMMPLFIILLK